MRFFAETAFEGLLRHVLERAGVPLRSLGTSLFLFCAGALFVLLGLATVLVSLGSPSPASAPLTIAVGGIMLLFGAANAVTGVGVLLGARWTNRLGMIVSAIGCAWFSVSSLLSVLSADFGAAIVSVVLGGLYALAFRVFYRARHLL